MIQRNPELAAEQLQHALLDLAIVVDIEYSTWQTRCHLASALTRLGRHREALELLAPDIQRHIRAGSSWFAWFQIRAGVDPLVGIGATGLAADLLDALEAHGYPVDELAAPRRRIGQLTEATEGTPIRRRALTVAEATAAIHHAVSERADAPARDLSGTAAPHEGRGVDERHRVPGRITDVRSVASTGSGWRLQAAATVERRTSVGQHVAPSFPIAWVGAKNLSYHSGRRFFERSTLEVAPPVSHRSTQRPVHVAVYATATSAECQ